MKKKRYILPEISMMRMSCSLLDSPSHHQESTDDPTSGGGGTIGGKRWTEYDGEEMPSQRNLWED